MSEFRTVLVDDGDNQPKDHRFIQMTLLLAAGFFIVYFFDPSPMRNIVLFVIIAWGLLLHFSHYVFKNDTNQRQLEDELIFGTDRFKIGNTTLDYEDIERVEIFVDGYRNQLKSVNCQLIKCDGKANTISVEYRGKTLDKKFQLIDETQAVNLYKHIASLDQHTKEKVELR